MIGGVTYEIVVTETVTECKHENTERVGVKDPTCTEPGSTGKLVCKDCNETLEEATEIAATGHSYGEWTVVKAATTEEEGLEKRVCEKCDAEQTRSIPKLEKPDQPSDTQKPIDNQKPSDNKTAGTTVTGSKAAKTGDVSNVTPSGNEPCFLQVVLQPEHCLGKKERNKNQDL